MMLLIVSTIPLFGQHKHEEKTGSVMMGHAMSTMMGKPTFHATVEGVHIKVWLMSQKQHLKLMKGKMGKMMMDKDKKEMKYDGTEMDKATMDSMMEGTHHIMCSVREAKSNREIANASVTISIVSPSANESSVELKPMMDCFGNGLSLDEKGKYKFTLSVSEDGVSRKMHFLYRVK